MCMFYISSEWHKQGFMLVTWSKLHVVLVLWKNFRRWFDKLNSRQLAISKTKSGNHNLLYDQYLFHSQSGTLLNEWLYFYFMSLHQVLKV